MDAAVIWIKSAICWRSDIGVLGFGLAGTIPVLQPIPRGLGGGIIDQQSIILILIKIIAFLFKRIFSRNNVNPATPRSSLTEGNYCNVRF